MPIINKLKALNKIKDNPLNLRYVSKELKNDKDVVMAAVSQDGEALYYASKDLKNDKDIAMAAVSENYWALWYVSDDLLFDKDIVKAALINKSIRH